MCVDGHHKMRSVTSDKSQLGSVIFCRSGDASQRVGRAGAGLVESVFHVRVRLVKGSCEERSAMRIKNGGVGWLAHERA